MSSYKSMEGEERKDPAGRWVKGKLHDRDRSTTQKRSLIAASFRI
jgi:hypothetical protein